MPTASRYPTLERSPGKADNWIEKSGGLPPYIDKIARSLHYERGLPIGRAIATAVEACRRWARGGGGVNADTRGKAAAAVAQWEAKKAAAKARRGADLAAGGHGIDLAAPSAPGVESDSTMIALMVPAETRRRVPGAPQDAHVTLGYVGPTSPEQAALIARVVERVARHAAPLYGKLGGLGQFPDAGDGAPFYAPVDVPGLEVLREAVVRAVDRIDGVHVRRDHGFTPHMTLKYVKRGDTPPAPVAETPVSFTRVSVVRGGQQTHARLGDDINMSGNFDVRSIIDLSEHPELSDDVVMIDLAQLDADELELVQTIDLAPGDYRPPYDWKHGYIPITPAAALSQAKGDRKRAARLLSKGKNLSPADAARKIEKLPGTKSRRKIAGERRKPDAPRKSTAPEGDDFEKRLAKLTPEQAQAVREARAKRLAAEDAAARGRAVPGEVSRAKAAEAKAEHPLEQRARVEAKDAARLREMSDSELLDAMRVASPRKLAVLKAERQKRQNAKVAETKTLGKVDVPKATRADEERFNASQLRRQGPSGNTTGSKRTTDALEGKSADSMTGAEKIAAAERMFGTGSAQARRARERFGDGTPEGKGPDGRKLDGRKLDAGSIEPGHVLTERSPISGKTRRQRVDKVYTPGSDGSRNAEVTDLETGRTSTVTLDGNRQHTVEGGKAPAGGGTVTSLDSRRKYHADVQGQNEQGRVDAQNKANADAVAQANAGQRAKNVQAYRDNFTTEQLEARAARGDSLAREALAADKDVRSRGNAKAAQGQWTQADRDQLDSLPWSRSSARGGEPAVSFSPKHEQALSDLEARGLIRMDRRGTSMQADDQYVLTDKGKSLIGDKDLHAQTQDRARAELANRAPVPNATERAAAKRAIERRGGIASPEAVDAVAKELAKRRESGGGSPKGEGVAARLNAPEAQRARLEGDTGGASSDSARNGYRDLDGPRLVDEVSRRGILPPGRASQKSDSQLRTMLKDHDRNPNASHEDNARARAHTPEGPADGTRVAYAGGGGKGSGVVVGRRQDAQGTILQVRDDKDGKTYEWPPEQVKPAGDAKPAAAADAPSTSSGTRSTNPDASIRVEHSADGTLVHGTERGDTETTQALKASGFKWSRNLNAWYLPRTWNEGTREQRVRGLESRLGDKIGVDRTDAPRRSAAEREAETRSRAAARADRLDSRAERSSAEAESRRKASDALTDGIPFGQPILVGHHSQRRHERTLERSRSHMDKSLQADRDAQQARAGAERARRTAEGNESTVTIGNRIERNGADLRAIERRLNDPRTTDQVYRDRLMRDRDDLRDRIQHDKSKLDAMGHQEFSRDTVSKGDFVKVRGQWYPVTRANAKTVGIPSPMGVGNGTTPWREVQEHRKGGEVSRADVAKMVQETSTAFPHLRRELALRAPEKDPDVPSKGESQAPSPSVAQARDAGRSAGGSATGQRTNTPTSGGGAPSAAVDSPQGISEDTARKLSDAQLERALERLYESGAFGSPAEAVLQAEMDRRDKIKAGGSPKGGDVPDPALDDATHEAASRPSALSPDVVDRLTGEQTQRALGKLMDAGYDADSDLVQRLIDRVEKTDGKREANRWRSWSDPTRKAREDRRTFRSEHGTREQQKTEYAAWVEAQQSAAEAATRGNLISRAGRRHEADRHGSRSSFQDSVDASLLWSASPSRIRKLASEEALRHFAEHPPLPFDAWRAAHLGATDRRAVESLRRRREQWLSEFG